MSITQSLGEKIVLQMAQDTVNILLLQPAKLDNCTAVSRNPLPINKT